MIILVPEEEENIANSNERTSPRYKRMTDHIAFLIDCARKGCIFLPEKELHTATKCQVVHLEERVRGGESLFSGRHNPEDRDNPTLLGFLLHPVSALHGVGWGVGGEADLAGALGFPVPLEQGSSPLWSLLLC